MAMRTPCAIKLLMSRAPGQYIFLRKGSESTLKKQLVRLSMTFEMKIVLAHNTLECATRSVTIESIQ